MKFSKILFLTSIFLFLMFSAHSMVLYGSYMNFPSYSKAEDTWMLYQAVMSSQNLIKVFCLVNCTVEGPTKIVSGLQIEYSVKFYFWNFTSNIMEIVLKKLWLEIVFQDSLVDYHVFSLNNYTVNDGKWLNLTLKLAPTPIIPHIKAISSSTNLIDELIYILAPVKYAYMRIWLSYYVTMKGNHTIHEQHNSVFPGFKERMNIILLDWSPLVFYQLPLFIVSLWYLFIKWLTKPQAKIKIRLIKVQKY